MRGGTVFIPQEEVMLNVLFGSTVGIMSVITISLTVVVIAGWLLYFYIKQSHNE